MEKFSNHEEIQDIIDINGCKSVNDIISSVEWSPSSFHKPKIKEQWYQHYSMPETYLDKSTFTKFNSYKVPREESSPTTFITGDVVSAIEAINHIPGKFNVDIRPKIFDSLTKTWSLLDSGSCVTCIPKGPNDAEDSRLKLKSVNGGSISTYGTKTIELQIGRKKYAIEAIIADIPQQIFGWDLFQKYKLGFDWNEWGDLIITDKKANISVPLKHECFTNTLLSAGIFTSMNKNCCSVHIK